MKNLFVVIFAAMVLLSGCKEKEEGAVAPQSKSEVSYAFGVLLGQNFKDVGVELDYNQLVKGIREVVEGRPTKIDQMEANMIVEAAMSAKNEEQNAQNKEVEDEFLTSNKEKSGVITTDSGLQYEVLNTGTGPIPTAEDTVSVNYIGTLLDGTQFDSSYDYGQPAIFPLAQVIPGWTEGIQLMNVGSKYKFYIPSSLAYGPEGAGGGVIPGYSTLIFEVELLSIEPRE